MLLLTLMMMQRDRYNSVTRLPILIPCETSEQSGVATFLLEFGTEQPVRAVTDADLGPKSKKRQEALNTMWDYERENFTAVLALLCALQTKDKLAIASARAKATRAMQLRRERDRRLGMTSEDNVEFGRGIVSLFGLKPGQEKEAIERWSGYRRGPKAETDHKWLLSQLMSEALDSVRLVLWWSGTQFRPALYCPKARAALYTFLLMKIAAGQGWAVCPKCGQFFVQKRPDQNYCSVAHREAHRVARWRAGKPSKSKKGKG
jgi:hypothetical protein